MRVWRFGVEGLEERKIGGMVKERQSWGGRAWAARRQQERRLWWKENLEQGPAPPCTSHGTLHKDLASVSYLGLV